MKIRFLVTPRVASELLERTPPPFVPTYRFKRSDGISLFHEKLVIYVYCKGQVHG